MSLSWETAVKPKLLTVVNSHKIVRARQSTFTPNCLQRLREFTAQWQQEACGSGINISVAPAVGADPDAFQVSPSEILLPDFACEVRLGPPIEQVRVLLVLADSLVLLAHTSAQVANEINRWTDQGLTKAVWQSLSSEMTSHLTVCLHHARLEIINCYSIMITSQCVRLEFTPTSFNAQSLFELLCAAKQLDLTSLFVSLPLDAKPPNYLGLQSSSRHVSQASLLSQVPLSSSPCSTKFFKKKFDSLWGYFNFSAPVIENSKMFYGAIANADLESNMYVARKAKAKRQKLWTVLKSNTVYMFKKRSGACNAEYEIDLENFTELDVTEDSAGTKENDKKNPLAGAIVMSGGPSKTLVLRFSNSKKCVYLTPLDRFDFKRWEEALNGVLRGDKRLGQHRNLECMNKLQARRISGLSNSFHNLSSANDSRQESPTAFRRADCKLGLTISRGSREMMASCTNLDELSGKQSPVACSKYSAAGACGGYAGGNNPIIRVDCIGDDEDEEFGRPDIDDEDDGPDCQLKRLEIWRSSQESIDQLTPEEIAELRRRRISTQIQLESLQSEIKKREMHLSPQQIQTLNLKMSDLYEDIQDMSITISKVDRKGNKLPKKVKKKSL